MTREELLQRIEQAYREKTTSFDLSFRRLSTLPPEIGQLTNLQQLYLRDNELSLLPPEIGQLTSLRELNLTLNRVESLPQ